MSYPAPFPYDPHRGHPRPTPSRTFGLLIAGTVLVCSGRHSLAAAPEPPFEFSAHGDIGVTGHTGAAIHDPDVDRHRLIGAGENMWFDRDAFHFAWREAAGDLLLAADIQWPVPGGNPHRKACLMIRQDLQPDSPYVDVVLHGDGLSSLQFRETRGGPTREIQGRIRGPRRFQLERHGDFFTWSVGPNRAAMERAGGCIRIQLADPVYVGLAVCSHDQTRLEEAWFSGIEFRAPPPHSPEISRVESTLEIIHVASRDRRAIHHTTNHLEAPNWSPDGTYLLYNSAGRIWRHPLDGQAPVTLDTGFANRCNNDHGLSPDGRFLAISDQSETGQSLIYVVPITGGAPRRVTDLGPSYWHGWSPDGRTLVYCAERAGEYDVYAIPVTGGAESRLTTAPGLDDGPEYSPDGRFIYFNSERTGQMQIWRMRPDGTEQTQITSDPLNNWFPHPSPDGRWIVFLSYGPEVKGHPANQDVQLRLLPTAGADVQVLASLFGGQGTINVPSWSPDSRHLAFVSYCPVFTP